MSDVCGRHLKIGAQEYDCGLPKGHKGRHKAPLRHGSRTAYINKGCRCDACRAAATEWTNLDRKSRAERRTKDARMSAARGRALTALAAAHPSEYHTLYEREMGR